MKADGRTDNGGRVRRDENGRTDMNGSGRNPPVYFSLPERTRPDTRHKMRLVCGFSPSKITRDIRTYGPTDLRTDTTSYRDATAHLKTNYNKKKRAEKALGKLPTPQMITFNLPAIEKPW